MIIYNQNNVRMDVMSNTNILKIRIVKKNVLKNMLNQQRVMFVIQLANSL